MRTELFSTSVNSRKAWWICFAGWIILLCHVFYYWPFLSDDSLISLRYSHRLLHGLGLTWNDGIRVEGYSNLSWVLLSALLGAAGIDLVDGVRVLGMICSFVVVATPCLLYRKGYLKYLSSVAISTLFLALCAPIAIWSIGGLEQPLVAALLCLAFLSLFPFERISWFFPGIFFAMITITRPDGILFAGCACLSVLFLRGFQKETFLLCFKIMFLPALFFVGQLIFRIGYYGTFVPNTALVKISVSMHRLMTGIKYVATGVASLFPFIILVPLSIYRLYVKKVNQEWASFLGITLLLWFAYLVFIGGDIFPGYRHFIPVIPLVGIAISAWVESLHDNFIQKIGELKITLGVLILFLMYGTVQFLLPSNARAKEERWEWDGKAIATMLHDVWKEEKPLFAITAAGCLPYWSEFPCIDMLGLNDYYIPRHPPKNFGKGYLGHDLGDAGYVLAQKPDLISFCGPAGDTVPCFTADEQLAERKEFKDIYRACYFETPPPHVTHSIIWVSKDSKKTGFKIYTDSVFVPCWFFSKRENPVTKEHNRFMAMLAPDENIVLHQVPLAAGKWKIVFENSTEPVLITNSFAGMHPGVDRKTFTTDSTGKFDVPIKYTGRRMATEGMVIRKITDDR